MNVEKDKNRAPAQDPPSASAQAGSKATTPDSKKIGQKSAPPSESKIDQNFVKMLNEDPYLGSQRNEKVQTIEDLVDERKAGEKPKAVGEKPKVVEVEQKPESKEKPIVETALEEPDLDTSC